MPWAPLLDVVAVLCCCDLFVSVMLCGIFFDTIEIYTFNTHARGMPLAPLLDVVAVLCFCDLFISVVLRGIFFRHN
jgi:hypothetical protein